VADAVIEALIGVFIGYGRLLSVLDLETPALTAG